MEYILTIMVLIAIFVILSSSYNLVIGYGGLATVAHPIFYALGAYASALLAIHFGLPAVVCVIAGALVAVVASVLLALSALARLRRLSADRQPRLPARPAAGHQELRVHRRAGRTVGHSEHRSRGRGARRPISLICGGVAVLTVWLIARIVHGPYGRAITAMRDEELAFSALGRNAMTIKVVIFAIGCGIAGIAGGLYAFYFQYVSPEQFEVLHSAAMLTMVVLGGMGTTFGPVVGAVVLIAIPQAITFLNLPPAVMAPMQGIIFTTLVMLFLFLRPRAWSER